jgi:hypothetical protein
MPRKHKLTDNNDDAAAAAPKPKRTRKLEHPKPRREQNLDIAVLSSELRTSVLTKPFKTKEEFLAHWRRCIELQRNRDKCIV